MPTIEPSSTAAPEIEDGLYTATWLDAEEKYVEADAFGKNHKLEIHLEVDLGDGTTETLDPLVNWAWSERATLYKFALGFGGVVDLGSAFDTDDMKGKKAQVLIKTDPEKSAWPKVVDVIAIKKGKSAPSAAQEARQTPPAAAAVPSIINPDGSVDFDTFWKTLRAHNISRTEVVAQVNGDIENLMAMEAADVALLLETLLSVPF